MNEHRRALRAQTLLQAHALLDRASPLTVTCLVQSLSPIGATVVFSEDGTIPRHFDLFIGKDSQAYRARRMWQRANVVGVMFVESRTRAEVMPD